MRIGREEKAYYSGGIAYFAVISGRNRLSNAKCGFK
jgi:hypothetical protein